MARGTDEKSRNGRRASIRSAQGKNGIGRMIGGRERTGRNSERRGWLCHAGFPHIHGSGPTSRCINIARASAARRFPQRCWLWETGEARGPVGMWETCRRAQISVVDRWAPCNSQRENAVSTVGLPVFGGRDFAAAELGLRNACIGHWRGGPRGAAPAEMGGCRPARRHLHKHGGVD